MKKLLLASVVLGMSFHAFAENPKTNADSYRIDITFATGKSEIKNLTPKQEAQLKNIARDMGNYPYARLDIEGHTDNVGSTADNLVLSQKRAEAIRDLLMTKYTIAGTRIKAMGYGDSKPIASNATAMGRAQNRRMMATVVRVDNPGSGNAGQL